MNTQLNVAYKFLLISKKTPNSKIVINHYLLGGFKRR